MSSKQAIKRNNDKMSPLPGDLVEYKRKLRMIIKTNGVYVLEFDFSDYSTIEYVLKDNYDDALIIRNGAIVNGLNGVNVSLNWKATGY